MEEGKSKEQWKTIGNKYFEVMQYEKALEAYSKGLKENPGDINLLSNRGATHLKLELYNEALKDCEGVLLSDQTHIKAIYRKTRALCSLEKFLDAKEFVTAQLLKIQDETNKSLLTDALQKVESLIGQNEHGIFYMAAFMKNPEGHFEEVATFHSPSVIISKTHVCNNQRGLFAIEDVKPGQLIIAEKAFAVQYKETESTQKLVTDIEKRLKSHSELTKEVYKLYAGPAFEIIEEGTKSVEEKIDSERIKSICQFNCFGGSIRPQTTASISSNPHETLGLWLLPSYLNHDCVDCNCSWKIFGNVIFIRASKMIRSGEEILISYCDSTAAYHERLEVLQKFGFVCHCRLCTLEQNELMDVAEERKKLLEAFNNSIETLEPSFAKLHEKNLPTEDIVRKIEDLRPDNSMNQFMSSSFALLGFHYQESGNLERSIVMLQKAYDCVKKSNLPLADVHLIICAAIAVSYIENGILDLAKQWLDTFKKELQIAYGSDSKDIIECICHDIDLINALKSEGLDF